MENVFELLREREEGLDKEAIDTVLACLDALTGAVEGLEADGAETLDPAQLVRATARLGAARGSPALRARGGTRSIGPTTPFGRASWTGEQTLEIAVTLARAGADALRARPHGAHRAGRARHDPRLHAGVRRRSRISLTASSRSRPAHRRRRSRHRPEVVAAVTDVASVKVTDRRRW